MTPAEFAAMMAPFVTPAEPETQNGGEVVETFAAVDAPAETVRTHRDDTVPDPVERRKLADRPTSDAIRMERAHGDLWMMAAFACGMAQYPALTIVGIVFLVYIKHRIEGRSFMGWYYEDEE